MMLFNLALFSSLLLATVVLAVPSELGARIARRQAGVNNRRNAAGAARDTTEYTSNWAGAVYDTESNGTFSCVTGTFTVPNVSGQAGSGIAFWVAIDGATCTSIFLVGVAANVGSSETTYSAWCIWSPDYAQFLNITVSAGDVVTLSALASSPNFGTAIIQNQSNGQVMSQSINFSVPLCGQNAEWIAVDMESDGSLLPLANFDTVTFTNAEASGPTGNYYPNGASIVEILQNNTILTDVSTGDMSVTIQHT